MVFDVPIRFSESCFGDEGAIAGARTDFNRGMVDEFRVIRFRKNS
jgi:hypothetical protein